MSSDPLQGSLQYLKGVGPRRAADLQRAGLATVEDLLYRFPTRYEDRGHFQTIASLKPGVEASVAVEVLSSGIRPKEAPAVGFPLGEHTGILMAAGGAAVSAQKDVAAAA